MAIQPLCQKGMEGSTPTLGQTMKHRIVGDNWDKFAKLIPDTASPIQKQEMRRAFYQGAHSLFWSINTILSPGTEATEEDVAIMEDVNQELKAFIVAIQKGEA